MAALIAATAVFLYYTIWTLFMVGHLHTRVLPSQLTLLALRGRRSPLAQLLSSTGMGNQDPRHPHAPWLGNCWIISRYGHDQKQQKEGR